MNVPSNPGEWTPEQAAEAMLQAAVDHSAPAWAEQLLLVMLMAKHAAPEEEAEAWTDHARDAFLAQVGTIGDRMAADVSATAEQTARFAQEVIAAIRARFEQLKAGTVQQGGRA